MKPILKTSLCAGLLLGTSLVVYGADVRTDYDKHADFSRIHTYCWGQVSTADPLYQERIKDEVNKDLQAKGWQESSGNCDATIFAKGNVRNQQELRNLLHRSRRRMGRPMGLGWMGLARWLGSGRHGRDHYD